MKRLTREQERMRDRRRESAWHPNENTTPWRCEACGVAVRRGRNDPCKCFPNLKETM